MAIGSGAEVGIVFGVFRDMSVEQKDLWFSTFRDRFGDNLLKGYATLDYPRQRGWVHESEQ